MALIAAARLTTNPPDFFTECRGIFFWALLLRRQTLLSNIPKIVIRKTIPIVVKTISNLGKIISNVI